MFNEPIYLKGTHKKLRTHLLEMLCSHYNAPATLEAWATVADWIYLAVSTDAGGTKLYPVNVSRRKTGEMAAIVFQEHDCPVIGARCPTKLLKAANSAQDSEFRKVSKRYNESFGKLEALSGGESLYFWMPLTETFEANAIIALAPKEELSERTAAFDALLTDGSVKEVECSLATICQYGFDVLRPTDFDDVFEGTKRGYSAFAGLYFQQSTTGMECVGSVPSDADEKAYLKSQLQGSIQQSQAFTRPLFL